MACAQTGSGKTLAFVLPIITGIVEHRLLSAEEGRSAPAALILSPTRELAVQIFTHVNHFSRGTGVRAFCAYGGVSVKYNLTQLEKGDVSVLIATPGRYGGGGDDYFLAKEYAYTVLRTLIDHLPAENMYCCRNLCHLPP